MLVTAVGPDSAEAIEAIQNWPPTILAIEKWTLCPKWKQRPFPHTRRTRPAARHRRLAGHCHWASAVIPAQAARHRAGDGQKQRGRVAAAANVRTNSRHRTASAANTNRAAGRRGRSGHFEAHQLIVQDPDLQTAVQATLDTEQINAEAAWYDAIEATAEQFAAMEDPYFQARAADVRDVGNRVLRHLLGWPCPRWRRNGRTFWSLLI